MPFRVYNFHKCSYKIFRQWKLFHPRLLRQMLKYSNPNFRTCCFERIVKQRVAFVETAMRFEKHRLTGDDPWTSATCAGKRTEIGVEEREGEKRLLCGRRETRVRQSLYRGSLRAPRVFCLLSCLSSSHRSIKQDHMSGMINAVGLRGNLISSGGARSIWTTAADTSRVWKINFYITKGSL